MTNTVRIPDESRFVRASALAQSDSAAYLAYHVRDNHRNAHMTTEYAEAPRDDPTAR